MSSQPQVASLPAVNKSGETGGAIPSNPWIPEMLICRATLIEPRASTKLFHQGFPVDEVFLIDKGLVKLTRINEEGQEMIVGIRSRGSLLGTASLIVRTTHSTTAVALTDCCLYRASTESFLNLVKTDSQFAWHLQQAHSQELHDQTLQLMGFRCLSAQQRFELLVRQLITVMNLDTKQEPLSVHLPLKYWEIAQLVGITPEHLSRTLRQLRKNGIMYRQKGTLIINDFQRLYSTTDI